MINIINNLVKKYKETIREAESKMATIELNAVYEEDMVAFLDSIEMLIPIKNGDINCSVCTTKIDLQNILTIYPENNDIKICCTDWVCYHTLTNEGA